MKIKTYDFFREATLRICSSLDIEKVMYRSIKYLQKVMPADQIILTFYDQRLNVIRTMARATPKAGIREDHLIQMPQNSNLPNEIDRMPREHICNNTEEEPINDMMAKAYGMQGYSLLQMFRKRSINPIYQSV